MYLLETKQVSQIDHYLCEHGYTIMQLISMAGSAFYSHVKQYKHPLILCGPGNNGADGLMVANLYLKDGIKADVYCYLGHIMNNNCKELITDLNVITSIDSLEKYDVVIDGVFGAGLNRAINQDLAEIFDNINDLAIDKYSIDIPSGINGDGIIYDHYFKCDHVITFMGLKRLYLIKEYQKYYHEVILEELGIDDHVFEVNKIAKIIDEKMILSIMKHRKYDDYKNRNGVILHVTGSKEYTGACLLAASGAVNSGCGIVKVASVPEVKMALNIYLPEAVFTSRDHLDFNVKAILIGSGLGINQESEDLIKYVIQNAQCPIVIDGDGITITAKHLDWIKDDSQIIFTPHLGEYARLDPDHDVDKFLNNYPCTLVLKGPNTTVGNNHERYINTTGNKAMAIGGSGDTLAGMISSYIGQGYSLIDACKLGVYFHGRAGDILAKENYMVLPSKLSKQVNIEMKKVEDLQ